MKLNTFIKAMLPVLVALVVFDQIRGFIPNLTGRG